MRRLVMPAFSDRAIQRQEPALQAHVTRLIQQLNDRQSRPVDIGKQMSYLTFDILGEVGFGESFNTLQSKLNRFLVELLFMLPKAGVMAASLNGMSILKPLLLLILPRGILAQSRTLWQVCREKVRQRIEMSDEDRGDIMSWFQGNGDAKGLSIPELEANGFLLIFAGAETTGSLLAAAVHLLAKHPAKLAMLQREIDSHYSSLAAIDFQTCARLPYLNAVLKEYLRVAAPIPGELPRQVPKPGALVSSVFVPGNVSTHMRCDFFSPNIISSHD